MANYIATTRSNYFRVKDMGAFEAWCEKRQLESLSRMTADGSIVYAISANNEFDCAGWPRFDFDDDMEIDFAAEVATHLDPRDIAILYEVGAEKLRYVTAIAVAVHADGRTVQLRLHDIHARAREVFGDDVTITEGIY